MVATEKAWYPRWWAPSWCTAAHEAVQPGTRRRFTAAEKLSLVKAAEAAVASGERGALEALQRSGKTPRSLLVELIVMNAAALMPNAMFDVSLPTQPLLRPADTAA